MKLYRVYGIRYEAVIFAESPEEAVQSALKGGQMQDWEDLRRRSIVQETIWELPALPQELVGQALQALYEADKTDG
jgi:hypothetical protein